MPDMIDIAIVGAGTAGLTAAIYAVRAGKSVKIYDGKSYGGQIINTPDIENYPGIKHISGFEFATGLYEQATALGAELEFSAVERIEKNGENDFTLKTTDGEVKVKAVILATGAENRKLGIDREEELIGSGISYCATCDGAFYKGKAVAVSGGGNTAIEDAMFLTNYCSKVYVIHRRDAFRADAKDVEKLKEKPNVEFVLNANVTALKGDKKLEAVEVTDKNTGEKKDLEVAGLFVAIGQAPVAGIFKNLVEVNEQGYIVAGEDCKTNVSGVYAAGDCRTKTVRQLTTAAADGAIAALAACSKL